MTYPPLGGVAITIFLDIFGLLALVTCTLSPINLIFSVQWIFKMEEKTEIGSFSKDDFEKKLKTVKNSLQVCDLLIGRY